MPQRYKQTDAINQKAGRVLRMQLVMGKWYQREDMSMVDSKVSPELFTYLLD